MNSNSSNQAHECRIDRGRLAMFVIVAIVLVGLALAVWTSIAW